MVLIIGILAAIALPQYEKAVTKARFAEAFVNLRTIGEAVKACDLETGEECWGLSSLSISIGEGDGNVTSGHFSFNGRWAANDDTIIGSALYDKYDVCICIHKDGHFSGSQNYDGCGSPDVDYDLLKVLGVEENTQCNCC